MRWILRRRPHKIAVSRNEVYAMVMSISHIVRVLKLEDTLFAMIDTYRRVLRRDDYPLSAKCPRAKEWIGECRQAESCATCPLRKEVKTDAL